MWFIQRFMKITWTEKANKEVLALANASRKQLKKTIKERQLKKFQHIMRKN